MTKHSAGALLYNLILITILIFSNQQSAKADVVAHAQANVASDTVYLCTQQEDGTVDLLVRSSIETNEWLTESYQEILRSKIMLRKRLRNRYLRNLSPHDKSDKKIKKIKGRWAKLKKLVKELHSCSTQRIEIATSNPCREIADGKAEIRSTRSSVRIVNGDACLSNTSSVVLLDVYTPFSIHTCSGTVIGPYTILTAAHCIEQRNLTKVVAYTSNTKHRVRSLTMHPSYNPKSFTNIERYDVALIETENRITDSKVSALAESRFKKGDIGIIAGYGETVDESYGFLQAAKVTISDVTKDAISTRYDNITNKSNACFGDSGGPLFSAKDGTWKVAGIISNGDLYNCGIGDTSRYTNVNFGPVKTFIAQGLKAHQAHR